MTQLQPNDATINLPLFKLFLFYQWFDTGSKKIFNVNVYRLVCVLITFSIQIVLAFGITGFFVQMEDKIDDILVLHLFFYYMINCMCLFKIIVFVYKADSIWDLFDVSNMNFIDNRRCRKYIEILHKYRALSIKLTHFFSGYAVLSTIEWALLPLVLNVSFADSYVNDKNKRFENIFNFRFPVTTFVYNSYYMAFYIMEVAVTVFLVYTYVVFDIFIISFCYTIIAHYEVITLAFENIGYNLTRSTSIIDRGEKSYYVENCYNDFISILADQQKLYLKLKLYYSIIWYIILSSVLVNSCSIIILTYLSVMIITSSESTSILSMIKLALPCLYLMFDLFILCNLLEKINIKKENVCFGMYSSNWTEMDMKFKNILLLAMQMNNANKLSIKASPRGIINSQLFASVLMKSYNIVSVMLNSRATNNERVA